MASGAAVRDRKKDFFWRRHVKAQAQVRLSVAAYCRLHGLRECGFYCWQRELTQRDASVPAAFVPARMAPEPPLAAASEERETLEILLPGDRRVRMKAPVVNRRMLADVLWALQEGLVMASTCAEEESNIHRSCPLTFAHLSHLTYPDHGWYSHPFRQ